MPRDEPGADSVASHIGNGIISAVNYQEVMGAFAVGISDGTCAALLDALHLDIHQNEPQHVMAAPRQARMHGSGHGARLACAKSGPVWWH